MTGKRMNIPTSLVWRSMSCTLGRYGLVWISIYRYYLDIPVNTALDVGWVQWLKSELPFLVDLNIRRLRRQAPFMFANPKAPLLFLLVRPFASLLQTGARKAA